MKWWCPSATALPTTVLATKSIDMIHRSQAIKPPLSRLLPFGRLALLPALIICLPLWAAPESGELSPSKIAVTLFLKDADIYVVRSQLEIQVPDFIFNLEFDERDHAQITLEAREIPLSRALDDICRTFHSAWTVDLENRAINIFPADIKRYAYYPFNQLVSSISLQDRTRDEIIYGLLASPLLKEKYPTLMYISMRRDGEKRYAGTIENKTLRYVLNWVCANDGNRDAWYVGINTNGFAALGVGHGSHAVAAPKSEQSKP